MVHRVKRVAGLVLSRQRKRMATIAHDFKKHDTLKILYIVYIFFIAQIFFFASEYHKEWNSGPDNFIVSQEYNKNYLESGLKEIDSILHGNHITAYRSNVEQIKELEVIINDFIKRVDLIQAKQQEIEKNLSERHNIIKKAKIERLLSIHTKIGTKLSPILAKIADEKRKVALLEEGQKNQSPYILLLIKMGIAQAKLDLAHNKKSYYQQYYKLLKDELTAQELKALTSRLPKELQLEISSGNRELEVLYKDMESFANNIRDIKDSVEAERISRLSFKDFIYFSVITATTTGYGDISPNSNSTRKKAMFQVLVSTVTMGVFISLLMTFLMMGKLYVLYHVMIFSYLAIAISYVISL